MEMTPFFFLKKLITYFIVPPGLFITILITTFIFLRKRVRFFMLFLALFIYALSIEPTRDLVVAPLEKLYGTPAPAQIREQEAYVVLGSSMNPQAPDLYGAGALDGEALHRVTSAYRLYLRAKKPILISGGTMGSAVSEAEIAKRYLVNLGIPDNEVTAETRSRDTYENAKFTKEICKDRHIKRIVLITSALHMKRSVMLFGRHFDSILPFPTAHKAKSSGYRVGSFWPEASNMEAIAFAIKEYMGILFYRITL